MAVIVIDTSAIIAYLCAEPEAATVKQVLTGSDELAISAVSTFEARIVPWSEVWLLFQCRLNSYLRFANSASMFRPP